MTQRDVHGRRESFKICIKAPANGMFTVLTIAQTQSLRVPIGHRQHTPYPIPPHNLEKRHTEVAQEGIPLEEDVEYWLRMWQVRLGVGRMEGA
jgi:hypothetical protein